MSGMVAASTILGLPKRLFIEIVGVILLIGLFYWALSSYGHRKFNEGVAANQHQVDQAVAKLKTDAQNSATKADDAAATRAAAEIEHQSADQEAVNEAERNGTSPLDALFGG
jgi:ABC-type nickel/cobalt efflux system permease component RcnA